MPIDPSGAAPLQGRTAPGRRGAVDLLRGLVPPRWRRARSEWLHAWRRDSDHFERVERRDFLRRVLRALTYNGIDGDYAEFGCCGGQTFGLAFDAMRHAGRPRRLWAFDSFAGLPPQAGPEDAHPMWVGGEMAISLVHFHQVCATYGMRTSDYRTVEGFYAESLADIDPARNDRPRDIALAYIDCDLHSSTRAVLRFLAPRLKHGMVLAFDDYHCWSVTATSGERKAVEEFFAARPDLRLLPYLSFGWHGMSFVVEFSALAGAAPTAG